MSEKGECLRFAQGLARLMIHALDRGDHKPYGVDPDAIRALEGLL